MVIYIQQFETRAREVKERTVSNRNSFKPNLVDYVFLAVFVAAAFRIATLGPDGWSLLSVWLSDKMQYVREHLFWVFFAPLAVAAALCIAYWIKIMIGAFVRRGAK